MRTSVGIGAEFFNHVPDPRHQMTDPKLDRRPVEGTAARSRAGARYRRPSNQLWVAAWRPLPLKFRIRSYHLSFFALLVRVNLSTMKYQKTYGLFVRNACIIGS